MSDATAIPLPNRGVLALSGLGVHGFLQGLVTNDVERTRRGLAVYAALLTPQGRFLHDFFICGLDGVLHLDCEADRLDDLARRLRRYRLRAPIGIEDVSADWRVEAVHGAAFGLGGAERGAMRRLGRGVAYVDPRLAGMGVRILRPAGEPTGLPPGDMGTYESVRYRLGVPDGSRDMPVDKAYPLESGLDRLNGVDWRKGCYVGQEVTARTHYRGRLRRRLLPVDLAGPVAPGTPILADLRPAGEMRSSLDGIGLALLRTEVVAGAERVEAGGVAVNMRPGELPDG